MHDERPAGEPGPDEVGADTEKFRAFVRDGDQMERGQPTGSAFRIATLLAGLVVLAAVLFLLLR